MYRTKQEIQNINNESRVKEISFQADGTTRQRSFLLQREIGQGLTSVCWKVQDENTKEVFALKQIKRKLSGQMLKRLKEEVNLHRNLDNPNIVRYFSTFEHDNKHYIRLQCCRNRTLRELIGSKKLTAEIIKIYSFKLLQGLDYLRKNRVFHGDLKPENILIGLNQMPRICDFGMSKRLRKDTHFSKDFRGTIQYMGPEYFTDKMEQRQISFAADVWSLGIIIYEMFTKTPLFSYSNRDYSFKKRENQIKREKLQFNYFSELSIPDDAKDLIRKMLEFESNKRPLPQDLLMHPFFDSVSKFTDQTLKLPQLFQGSQNIPLFSKAGSQGLLDDQSRQREITGILRKASSAEQREGEYKEDFNERESMKKFQEDSDECSGNSDDISNLQVYESQQTSESVIPRSSEYTLYSDMTFVDDQIQSQSEQDKNFNKFIESQIFFNWDDSQACDYQVYFQIKGTGYMGIVFPDETQLVTKCGSDFFAFIEKKGVIKRWEKISQKNQNTSKAQKGLRENISLKEESGNKIQEKMSFHYFAQAPEHLKTKARNLLIVKGLHHVHKNCGQKVNKNNQNAVQQHQQDQEQVHYIQLIQEGQRYYIFRMSDGTSQMIFKTLKSENQSQENLEKQEIYLNRMNKNALKNWSQNLRNKNTISQIQTIQPLAQKNLNIKKTHFHQQPSQQNFQ